MYQLTDDQNDCDNIALDVILSENSSKEVSSETPCIVKITKFMACKEVMTVGSAYKWNYLYLIVTGFEILCHLNHRRWGKKGKKIYSADRQWGSREANNNNF